MPTPKDFRWIQKSVTCVLFICLPAFLNAAQDEDYANVSEFNPHLPFECSFVDDYHFFTLDNGLKVVYLRDENVSQARVAMAVGAGSQDDPHDIQGMAHLLEHMLFLGTKNYPDPKAYKAHITEHNGYENASTSYDSTKYYFRINTQHFDAALSMFSEQFHSPLLEAEQIAAEKLVVNAEYEMRRGHLYRQLMSVAKEAFFEDHPIKQMAIGNSETLSVYTDEVLSKKMQDWFSEYYTAGNMALVIKDKREPEQIKELVNRLFSPIQPTKEAVRKSNPELKLKSPTPRIARSYINEEDDGLLLLFPMPKIDNNDRLAATQFVEYMLERSLPYSFVGRLDGYNYTSNVYVDATNETSDIYLLEVYMGLNGGGGVRYWQVTRMLFEYVKKLKKEPLEEWRVDEFNRQKETSWCYTDRPKIRDFAYNLLTAQPELIFSRGYHAMEYAPEVYQKILESIDIEKMAAVAASPRFNGSNTTQWFGIDYEEEVMSRSVKKKANTSDWAEFYIDRPEPNPYLPKTIPDVSRNLDSEPERLAELTGLNAWFGTNKSHGDPRAFFYVELEHPVFDENKRNSALTNIYRSMLRDKATAINALAEDADGTALVARRENSLGFYFQGYSESIGEMLQQMLLTMNNLKINDRTFEPLKSGWMSYLEDPKLIDPETQAFKFRTNLVAGPPFSYKDKYNGIRRAGAHHLRKLIKEVKQSARITSVAYGNISKENAIAWNNQIAMALERDKSSTDKKLESSKIRLPEGLNRVYRKTDFNDAVALMYVQGKENNYTERAYFLLLENFLSEEFFSDLRTEKSLAYDLSASSRSIRGIPGFQFKIVSPYSNPITLEKEILDFKKNYESTLAVISEERLNAAKKALIKGLTSNHDSLEDETDHYWYSLRYENENFTYHDEIAAALEQINITDLNKWYKSRFLEGSSSILSFLFEGINHETSKEWIDDNEGSFINDFEEFFTSQKGWN